MGNSKCRYCGSDNLYDADFDSYYCGSCQVWLEKKCKDPACAFCPNRPEKPRKKTKYLFEVE